MERVTHFEILGVPGAEDKYDAGQLQCITSVLTLSDTLQPDMQLVASLCLLLAAAAWGAPADTYSNKYDAIDVDKILKNDRVVTQYVNCLLDKGPCSPEGRDFRQHLPEALATQCGKCTPAQKNIIRKASKHIIATRPADWATIKAKYDPKGQHHNTFQAFLNSN